MFCPTCERCFGEGCSVVVNPRKLWWYKSYKWLISQGNAYPKALLTQTSLLKKHMSRGIGDLVEKEISRREFMRLDSGLVVLTDGSRGVTSNYEGKGMNRRGFLASILAGLTALSPVAGTLMNRVLTPTAIIAPLALLENCGGGGGGEEETANAYLGNLYTNEAVRSGTAYSGQNSAPIVDGSVSGLKLDSEGNLRFSAPGFFERRTFRENFMPDRNDILQLNLLPEGYFDMNQYEEFTGERSKRWVEQPQLFRLGQDFLNERNGQVFKEAVRDHLKGNSLPLLSGTFLEPYSGTLEELVGPKPGDSAEDYRGVYYVGVADWAAYPGCAAIIDPATNAIIGISIDFPVG